MVEESKRVKLIAEVASRIVSGYITRPEVIAGDLTPENADAFVADAVQLIDAAQRFVGAAPTDRSSDNAE